MPNKRSSEVVVTGLGPVTGVGSGPSEFWESLRIGRHHVEDRTLVVDLGKTVDLPVATMPVGPEIGTHMSRLDELEMGGHRDLGYSLRAIELALADAGLEFDRDQNQVGMVQAYEAPGVERAVGAMFDMFAAGPPENGPPPVYEVLAPRFYNMQPFIYVHVVAKAFGFRGFCTNVHNACSTGAFAIEVAASRIRDGSAEAMIVVAGEAFETAVRLEWFRRLGLYATTHTMRPFDSDPSGFYVGEGAIAVVLESERSAEARGATPYARYAGGAFAHQGWKQTLPDIRSARLKTAVTQALSEAGVEKNSVDVVVPHAACTSLSDNYEASCASDALNGDAESAVVCAFKPNIGHWLAGSGLIEISAGLLAMRHATVPPTLHTPAGQYAGRIPISHEAAGRKIRTLLKLSTGFTGHDAASVFVAC